MAEMLPAALDYEQRLHVEPMTDAEIDATVKAIKDSMDYRVGFGFNVDEIVAFEEAFASYCGTAFAVSLVTASVGLDIAMMCLDLEPGDEVITPALNFKACSLAIIGQGGKPVLCEIDPQTFNADPADIEKRITPKTSPAYSRAMRMVPRGSIKIKPAKN